MALVVLCGLPSSGKSSLVQPLCQLLETSWSVVVVDEPSLHLQRQQSYQDASAEKRTRGQLKAAVDRALAKDKAVVLDSMNSIKGYRYEIWCLARAAGLKYCLIHCDIPDQQAQTWNSLRQKDSYDEPVFKDLAGRFEVPDSKNRWEKPLFRIKPDSPDLLPALQDACNSVAKGSTRATPAQVRSLQPTTATTNPNLSQTNLLAELDRAAQDVIDAVLEAQARSVQPGGSVLVELDGLAHPVALSRHISLPEMRRQKRAFVKIATQNSFAQLRNARSGRQMFIDYLQEAIE